MRVNTERMNEYETTYYPKPKQANPIYDRVDFSMANGKDLRTDLTNGAIHGNWGPEKPEAIARPIGMNGVAHKADHQSASGTGLPALAHFLR